MRSLLLVLPKGLTLFETVDLTLPRFSFPNNTTYQRTPVQLRTAH